MGFWNVTMVAKNSSSIDPTYFQHRVLLLRTFTSWLMEIRCCLIMAYSYKSNQHLVILRSSLMLSMGQRNFVLSLSQPKRVCLFRWHSTVALLNKRNAPIGQKVLSLLHSTYITWQIYWATSFRKFVKTMKLKRIRKRMNQDSKSKGRNRANKK